MSHGLRGLPQTPRPHPEPPQHPAPVTAGQGGAQMVQLDRTAPSSSSPPSGDILSPRHPSASLCCHRLGCPPPAQLEDPLLQPQPHQPLPSVLPGQIGQRDPVCCSVSAALPMSTQPPPPREGRRHTALGLVRFPAKPWGPLLTAVWSSASESPSPPLNLGLVSAVTRTSLTLPRDQLVGV